MYFFSKRVLLSTLNMVGAEYILVENYPFRKLFHKDAKGRLKLLQL